MSLFDGVPPGLLCNLANVKRTLNVSDEGWSLIRRAGMPVLMKVGRTELGWTTDIIKWMKSKPMLMQMASTLRKKRQRRRNAK